MYVSFKNVNRVVNKGSFQYNNYYNYINIGLCHLYISCWKDLPGDLFSVIFA